MVDVVRTVKDTKQSLHDKYQRTPTVVEISEASGMEAERVLTALKIPFRDGLAGPADRRER